jgi:SAM-dependent methyltransferase
MFSFEYASRESKARKILSIIQDAYQGSLHSSVVLDIGCGDGAITNTLSAYVKQIVGVDIAFQLVKYANTHFSSLAGQVLQGDGSALPFADEQFDIVICAQVYEHTLSRSALVYQINRVLRPEGLCFFSGPNRLALFEEHYWLPFLSWFPRPLANLYMRLLGYNQDYDIYPMFYWQLRRLWRDFKIVDYTPRLLHEPRHFAIEEELKRLPFIKSVPLWIGERAALLLPNFNWVMIKKP